MSFKSSIHDLAERNNVDDLCELGMMVLCQWYGMLTMPNMMVIVVESHTCFKVIIDRVNCLNVVPKKTMKRLMTSDPHHQPIFIFNRIGTGRGESSSPPTSLSLRDPRP